MSVPVSPGTTEPVAAPAAQLFPGALPALWAHGLVPGRAQPGPLVHDATQGDSCRRAAAAPRVGRAAPCRARLQLPGHQAGGEAGRDGGLTAR